MGNGEWGTGNGECCFLLKKKEKVLRMRIEHSPGNVVPICKRGNGEWGTGNGECCFLLKKKRSCFSKNKLKIDILIIRNIQKVQKGHKYINII